MVKFVWDENKRLANIRRHGLDFIEIPSLFESYVFTIEDDRFDYGETRYFSLGLLSGRVIAVSYTESNEEIRIISARRANKNEQKKYYNEIAD
ncbi:MAG: BrnT family toxin [Acidobacteria bacterium]|nr:BrnT family toxin [Acidobacteriota bacterium]